MTVVLRERVREARSEWQPKHSKSILPAAQTGRLAPALYDSRLLPTLFRATEIAKKTGGSCNRLLAISFNVGYHRPRCAQPTQWALCGASNCIRLFAVVRLQRAKADGLISSLSTKHDQFGGTLAGKANPAAGAVGFSCFSRSLAYCSVQSKCRIASVCSLPFSRRCFTGFNRNWFGKKFVPFQHIEENLGNCQQNVLSVLMLSKVFSDG